MNFNVLTEHVILKYLRSSEPKKMFQKNKVGETIQVRIFGQ